ncbi:hypothetical protein PU630_15560 [Microbacterium horticulturae]|uniref:Uncharacterized protein n=1 Tax=Microbacterium horticulturae TaxID=3028316 RepID=A0ABY8C0S9_9MICO|nr:hypothetical protein [Microbacterium sp. KACC 23027]WEG08641.1 hypothetical protein PU630_15560 [Microbacterium sp. KACC 23027]
MQGGVDRLRGTAAQDRVKHYSNFADWLKNDELTEELAKLGPPPEGNWAAAA